MAADKTRWEKLMAGFGILSRYEANPEFDFQHDIMYVGGPHPDKLSPEDKVFLEEFGFSWDEEHDSWYHYS